MWVHEGPLGQITITQPSIVNWRDDVADQPMSMAMQTLIRLPLLLVAVAGVVLFVMRRRQLGGAATALGVVGSSLWVIDAVLAQWWTRFLQNWPSYAMNHQKRASDIYHFSNLFEIVDFFLIALALALVLAAALVPRPTSQPAVYATAPPR